MISDLWKATILGGENFSGVHFDSAIPLTRCCRLFHHILSSEDAEKFWKRCFVEKFPKYQNKFRFYTGTGWKVLFAQCSKEALTLEKSNLKLEKLNRNYSEKSELLFAKIEFCFSSLSLNYLDPDHSKIQNFWIEIRKDIKIEKSSHPKVCYVAGKLLGRWEDSKDIIQSENAIYDCLSFASDQGLTLAMSHLGWVHLYGFTPVKEASKVKAFDFFKKGADLGDMKCQYEVSQCFFQMNDMEKYEEYCKKSADQGYVLAQLELSGLYKCKSKFKEAFTYCKSAADQGNRKAQYDLYFYYKNGEGISMNLIKANAYLKLSAAQEHPLAASLI